MPRRLWLSVFVPGALAAALALVLVAVLTGGERGGATLRPPAVPRSAPPSSPLDDVLPRLQAYVEQARGLVFKRPVQVQILEGAAFRRRIQTITRMSLVEGNRRQRVLKALGLVSPDVNLSRAQRALDASGILGLYDPRGNRLVVRGRELTPLVRGVLVHELTHALQDQHFDLSRPRRRVGQSAQGWNAVVEGDATRIEDLYLASLSEAERQQAREELATLEEAAEEDAESDVPPAILRFARFPYEVGADFATAVAASGPRALDDAFADPPRTAEQLLHPDTFLAREAGVPVAPPPAGGRVVQTDTLGEFGLQLLLDGVVSRDEMRRATGGWGGDRYVAWAEAPATACGCTW